MILILIPEVWREEMKLLALHISYSTKLWFIHSFPFWPDPDSKPCFSTIFFSKVPIIDNNHFLTEVLPTPCPNCSIIGLVEHVPPRLQLLLVRVADPDPVGSGVFAWIRIRFSNFSGSGIVSGFSPDSGTKKNRRKVSKSDLSEENLKFMTKDRQKMKKATISY